MNRRALLAMVHIARKDLGLDEDTYRDVLERVTGRASARDLDERDLSKVIDAFKVKGWQPKAGKRHVTKSDKPYVRKVYALWGELHRKGIVKGESRGALRAFVKRTTTATDPEWLTLDQAMTVIEALKQWRARVEREALKKAGDEPSLSSEDESADALDDQFESSTQGEA